MSNHYNTYQYPAYHVLISNYNLVSSTSMYQTIDTSTRTSTRTSTYVDSATNSQNSQSSNLNGDVRGQCPVGPLNSGDFTYSVPDFF